MKQLKCDICQLIFKNDISCKVVKHDLHQHIGFPTRGDNYLDLLFTTGAPVCVKTHPSHDVIQSDHTGVEGIITPPLPPLRHVAPLRYTRNWKRVCSFATSNIGTTGNPTGTTTTTTTAAPLLVKRGLIAPSLTQRSSHQHTTSIVTTALHRGLGGGVLIAVSAALRTRAIEATPIPNCEAVWVEVLLDQGSRLIMGNVYIPPDSDPACIDQLSATLSLISESTKPTDSIIIFGDFNHPGCVWNYDRDNVLVPSLKSLALSNCLLMECIAEHDLHQHIGFPTRGDNYLDLLFTTGAPVCVRTHPSHDVIQSDHTGVEGIITPPLPPLRHVAP
ncbi:hypothetical protein B566_EDAN018266, partial [Ephemera danica]